MRLKFMIALASSSLFGSLSPCISTASSQAAGVSPIYQGATMQVVIPEYPLAGHSVKITPIVERDFNAWQSNDHLEVYQLTQRIVKIWKDQGIQDYLVTGKQDDSGFKFDWEVVPYSKEGWRFWKQFSVLWNMIFPNSSLSENEREKATDEYRELFQAETLIEVAKESNVVHGSDPFCNPEIIQKQLVFEGREVNVLYNYAPIGLGKDKLHFLIVPKIHRIGFSELSETEYLEAMELSQKLINFYQKRHHPIVYVFHKTGGEAGQSVPHWHQHIVFAETGMQEFFSKMAVLKNMMIGASPLPSDELKGRVQLLKTDLQSVLKD